MKFLVRLVPLQNRPAKVSIDYRRRFISLLKAILGEEEFADGKARPYTFAVYFGKEAKVKEDVFENVKLINFRFSTGDSLLAVKFYNGVLKLKKKGYSHKVGNGRFLIERISAEEEKRVKDTFKTLSPVVVERIGFSSKNPEERYITPNEDGFTESLLENTVRRYSEIKGKEPKVGSFTFKPVQVREEFIKHYGGYLRGFIGKFRIESDSEELLRFIYQYGLGLRTGQGFGYLEVEDGKA